MTGFAPSSANNEGRMKTEVVSETLDTWSELMRVVARDDFSIFNCRGSVESSLYCSLSRRVLEQRSLEYTVCSFWSPIAFRCGLVVNNSADFRTSAVLLPRISRCINSRHSLNNAPLLCTVLSQRHRHPLCVTPTPWFLCFR